MEETKEFLVIRPYCIAVLQRPSPSSCKDFLQVFNTFTDNPPNHLAEYILFPFALQLKVFHNYKEDTKTCLLECLAEVLSRFAVHRWDMFVELLQRLHLLIGRKDDPTKIDSGISEELLDNTMRCISNLFENSLGEHYKELYDSSKIHIVAHSIVLLLQVMNMETKKSIRLKSVGALEKYVNVCMGHEAESQRFSKFLPGVVTSLKKIVDVRVGRIHQDLVVKGLELLSKLLEVCIQYADPETLRTVDANLQPFFSEITKDLILSENKLYRITVMNFSRNLFDVMNGKLELCQQVLLDCLLVLRTDTQTDINEAVENFIRSRVSNNQKYASNNYDSVISDLELTYAQLQASDDREALISLKKLAANVSISNYNYLEIQSLLPKVCSLIQQIVQAHASIAQNELLKERDQKTSVCVQICHALTLSCSSSDLFEEFQRFLTDFDGSLDKDFLGYVFCNNEVLRCFLVYKKRDAVSTAFRLNDFEVMEFVTAYLDILNMQSTEVVLAVLESEAPKTQSVIEGQKRHLLEGLGIMAQICPYVLSTVLYSLVEYAGLPETELLSQTARSVLRDIADSRSLESFLQENISIIMNELSSRFLNLSLYPNCPNALIFLAQYFDFRQVEFVNLVDGVLVRSCDSFCGAHLEHLYVRVFTSYLFSLWKWKNSESSLNPSSTASSFLNHKIRKPNTLLHRLSDFEKLVGLTNAAVDIFKDSTDSAGVDPVSESQEGQDVEYNEVEQLNEKEAKLTPELNLALQLCHRVLNFLPHHDRLVRLGSIECLMKGVNLLKNDEDFLLPLSHTIWQNLIPRFSEKDLLIVKKSFELLLEICSVTGTFLKKRVVDEVLPKLSALIVNLAKESENIQIKNSKYYTYTQSYKLQLTILQGIAQLCGAIDIQEDLLDQVITGCVKYLNPSQHKNLKNASQTLIEDLAKNESSRSVWMKLISHGLINVPSKPRHPLFTPVPDNLVLSNLSNG